MSTSPVLLDFTFEKAGQTNKNFNQANFSNVKIRCYRLDNAKQSVIASEAEIIRVIECEPVQKILNQLRNKSSNVKPFVDGTHVSINSRHTPDLSFGAGFLLMKLSRAVCIEGKSCQDNVLEPDQLANRCNTNEVQIGQDVYTVYAPFGATEFINSCSRGCLSNRVENLLYLIDGRLGPNCEGAPVYSSKETYDENHLIGFVMARIAVDTQQTGFSFVVPKHVVYNALVANVGSSTLGKSQSLESAGLQKTLSVSTSEDLHGANSNLTNAIKNCVRIEFKNGWGSGVVIAPGIILTNSHVIGFGEDNFEPIWVRWMGNSTRANVIFHVNRSCLLDLALLKYDSNFGPKGLEFANSPPERGEKVFCVGYPLLVDLKTPSLSSGVVLNSWEGSAGFSATCSTHPGASGGPILRINTIKQANVSKYVSKVSLLGIVIGVITVDGTPFNEVNTCISTSAIKQPLLNFIKTNDAQHLQCLEHHDDYWLKSLLHAKCKY
ncbi:trypsin domain containing 1 [Nesidiocoris tenuis]|uniref:Peroxisomal leader peptide-processing protease n=1 Tax=Nesidiocoris tenuis TaxID=355587 RepID=A0ABN7AKC9_9HEMI|nr:trypsin domain containing 1 [Nesidiocoris tenuis]